MVHVGGSNSPCFPSKEDFLSFRTGDMIMSYKAVLLKGMLTLADVKGEVDLVKLPPISVPFTRAERTRASG